MRQVQLEQAINRLARLLRDGESDEAKYQEYFERNPVVFEALGYSAAYPKPQLPLPDGEHLEPDFLVKRPDGLYEVFELKTPQERLVHGKKHRDKLYARVEEYISQVENYSEYFDDSEHRTFVEILSNVVDCLSSSGDPRGYGSDGARRLNPIPHGHPIVELGSRSYQGHQMRSADFAPMPLGR